MHRLLTLLVVLALVPGCASKKYVLQTEVGEAFPPLEFQVLGQPLVVLGVDGRLIVNGADCGPLEEGDHLQMDVNGVVYINRQRRWPPGGTGE